ncbi:MAG TPA: hypothetical protein PKM25_14940, partial [Candidatus Ozemobacteraceae bacterium]|nr:hypothetical protein [Candidatus Ozemobacteraceae bacterium]
SLFLSEFLILKAAVDGGQFIAVVVFLLGTGVVFVGALGHALPLAWGTPAEVPGHVSVNGLDGFLVAAPLVVLLVLGVWMPESFQFMLNQAAAVIENTQQLVPHPVQVGGAP